MFNKVILEGRLVDDVQLKTIPNSDSMVAEIYNVIISVITITLMEG